MISDETRKEWVAALRSGDYKQGNNWLRADDKYCCLGVLCEITPDIARTSGGYLEPEGVGEELDAEFNRDTLSYFGLDEHAQRYLIYKNDAVRATFEQIADDIEKGQVYFPADTEDRKPVQI